MSWNICARHDSSRIIAEYCANPLTVLLPIVMCSGLLNWSRNKSLDSRAAIWYTYYLLPSRKTFSRLINTSNVFWMLFGRELRAAFRSDFITMLEYKTVLPDDT